MSYYGLTAERIDAATKQHSGAFFDKDLNPIEPKEGQWFCEFDVILTFEGEEEVRDQALVEYVGEGRVQSEYDEYDREPHGDILILQNQG